MSAGYIVYYPAIRLHRYHSVHDQNYWHVSCPIQIELTKKINGQYTLSRTQKTLEVVAW